MLDHRRLVAGINLTRPLAVELDPEDRRAGHIKEGGAAQVDPLHLANGILERGAAHVHIAVVLFDELDRRELRKRRAEVNSVRSRLI